MLKGFKVRLLPTEEQEKALWRDSSVARFAWNWGLSLQMARFAAGEKLLREYALRAEFLKLKDDPEYAWLAEASSKAPVFALFDLMTAYKNFFRIQKQGEKFTAKAIARARRQKRKLTTYDMKGHPKFKKKGRTTPSFANPNEALYFMNGAVVLLKVGHVKIQTNRELPQGKKTEKFYNPRVSYENGKWILSFAMEVENQDYTLNEYSVGVDLGIKHLAVISCDGNPTVIDNVNKTRKVKRLKRQLKHAQRLAVKKAKGSKNQQKAYARSAELSRRISAIRHDYTHKATRKIVDLLPARVVIEDLNVSGMMKNRHLSRAVSEQTFYKFRQQLEYKCAARGIDLIVADRFFPSSKKCSSCGKVNKGLQLKDRTFNCPHCGLSIDRDFNAALNLEAYVT